MKQVTTVCMGLLLAACVTSPSIESMVADGGEVITGDKTSQCSGHTFMASQR